MHISLWWWDHEYYATRSKWDYNILHILMQSFNESDLLKRLKPKVRYQAHIENKGACIESGEFEHLRVKEIY